jgi:hypothetical protein
MGRYDRKHTQEEELDDSSYVQMESAPTKSKEISQVDEAAVNAVLKAEMDKINESLAKIT